MSSEVLGCPVDEHIGKWDLRAPPPPLSMLAPSSAGPSVPPQQRKDGVLLDTLAEIRQKGFDIQSVVDEISFDLVDHVVEAKRGPRAPALLG